VKHNPENLTLTEGLAPVSKYAPIMKTTYLLLSILLIDDPSNGYALDLQPAIDPLAKQLLAAEGAVGFVVGIYKDGEKQVIAYGETEKGKGIAPDGDTIYEIGSLSNAFTGALLADLVQRGRVKLGEPMQKYLPKSAKTDLKNTSHITFEHLATHTSGLPALPDNLQPADIKNPYSDYSFKQMYAFLKDHELRRAPGDYEFSNFGMGLLGVLLAGRERMSYEALLIEHIAKPCRMADTCVKLSSRQRRRLAPPYDAALQPAGNWDMPALAGAGGIRSTTKDMLKFIAANLADDDKPLTKALQLSHKKRHTMPNGPAIGLGWLILPDGITLCLDGMTGGYSAWLAVVPARDFGIVVLSNTAAPQVPEFGAKITQIALGETTEPLAASPAPQVTLEVLKKYEGVYAINPQFALTVTVEGDKLMVQATGQQKLQFDPETETTFVCKAVGAHIFFVADKSGAFNYLVLHQNGVNQTATRQDAAVDLADPAAEYPKRAPFTSVGWQGYKPVVKIGDEWLTLISLDGVTADDIVAFSRRTYKDLWRKRFQEDLVELLAKMGHEPKDTVQLVVSPPGSSEKRTLKDVPMTEANRQAIKASAGQSEPAIAAPVIEVAPEVLKKYEGVYAINPQFAITVTLEGNQLVVQATGQQKLHVHPESQTKFSVNGVDAQLTFAGDKNGKAELLILHQNGINQVANRQN
jgi:CubicO group peptidase (beta-lactamase class C family)